VSQSALHACVNGFFDPVVTLLFQLVSQFRAARPYDASVEQNVNVIGRDVIENPLVVSHQDHSILGGT